MSVETLTTISPSTNQPILTRHGLSESELQALPAIAASAFKSFRQTSLSERQKIVEKALRLLAAEKDDVAKELAEQIGRPIAYGGKEISTAVKRGEYLLKVSDEGLQASQGSVEEGFKRYIRKLPVGPVLILFAWNYPYLILVNSLIAAILAGNTVILKPSPQTPTVVERIHRVFRDAGLPNKVIQYVHCGSLGQVANIVRSPDIQLVCFTGSVKGGLAVQRAASDRVSVKVGLELGGKDAAYVRRDVDIKWAAEEIVDGAIFNSGQSCCSVERVYVDSTIHDDFVLAVQEVLKGYKMGDPLDPHTNIGPVVSKQSVRTLQLQIKDALEKGAKDVSPSNESHRSCDPNGNFISPVVLKDVTHEMIVMKEETFGPIIPIMKVTGDDDAVNLINDSQFGLTASIWTKDMEKGEQLAEEIETGTVFVNRCDFPSADLAWTGWKESGKGHTLSRFGFDQFVKLKSFHIKHYAR